MTLRHQQTPYLRYFPGRKTMQKTLIIALFVLLNVSTFTDARVILGSLSLCGSTDETLDVRAFANVHTGVRIPSQLGGTGECVSFEQIVDLGSDDTDHIGRYSIQYEDIPATGCNLEVLGVFVQIHDANSGELLHTSETRAYKSLVVIGGDFGYQKFGVEGVLSQCGALLAEHEVVVVGETIVGRRGSDFSCIEDWEEVEIDRFLTTTSGAFAAEIVEPAQPADTCSYNFFAVHIDILSPRDGSLLWRSPSQLVSESLNFSPDLGCRSFTVEGHFTDCSTPLEDYEVVVIADVRCGQQVDEDCDITRSEDILAAEMTKSDCTFELEFSEPLRASLSCFFLYTVQFALVDPDTGIPASTSDPVAPEDHMEILVDICDATPFTRGDANDDLGIDITDALTVLRYLFIGDTDLACMDAGDADDSGTVDFNDGLHILRYLFIGGSPIPAPGTESCGDDPTEDSLESCSSTSCAPDGPTL